MTKSKQTKPTLTKISSSTASPITQSVNDVISEPPQSSSNVSTIDDPSANQGNPRIFLPSSSFIAEGGAKLTVDIVSRKQRKVIEILAKQNAKLSQLLQQSNNKSFNTGGLTPILRQILINAEKMPLSILLNEGTLKF